MDRYLLKVRYEYKSALMIEHDEKKRRQQTMLCFAIKKVRKLKNIYKIEYIYLPSWVFICARRLQAKANFLLQRSQECGLSPVTKIINCN